MRDQADELRQLVRRAALPGRASAAAPLIVVAGAKGGVGASTIAMQIAAAMSAQGQRTVLVDADLDHGGATYNAQAHSGTLLDVLAGRRTVHEVLEPGPAGIQFLPGSWAAGTLHEPTPASVDRLIAQLTGLGLFCDAVIVDVGSARSAWVRRFWQSARLVLLVTRPDDASVMEAYAAVKLLSAAPCGPIYTLVNCASDDSGDAHGRIARACQRFLGLAPSPAGSIPCEGDIGELGRPLAVHSPRCAAAREIERTAQVLWAAVQPPQQAIGHVSAHGLAHRKTG